MHTIISIEVSPIPKDVAASTLQKNMQTENYELTLETIEQYAVCLEEQERAFSCGLCTSICQFDAGCCEQFFKFMGWQELTVKPLKIQKALFCDERREMSKEKYIWLVEAARMKGNERLSLILQTICAIGIRVIFMPDKLCELLEDYLKREGRSSGPIFVTCNGKTIDQSRNFQKILYILEQDRASILGFYLVEVMVFRIKFPINLV